MAIILGVPPETVEQFPEVFMQTLEITQQWNPDATAVPVYGVRADYMRYRTINGVRTHSSVVDFVGTAHYLQYAQNDPVLLGALNAIQEALAVMIAREKEITATVI